MSEGNSLALAEALSAAQQVPRCYVTIDVPEVEMTLRLQSLTEQERSDYQTFISSSEGAARREKLGRARRRLLSLCLVDNEGNRLVRDHEEDELADIDVDAVRGVYDACRVHCALDADDMVEDSSYAPQPAAPCK